MNRRLLDFKLESYNETEKQLLSKEDKKKRLKWCLERKNWAFEKWSSVLFSDESNFQLVNRKTTARVRRFKNEKYESRFIKQRVQAGGGSVGIWGAISSNGTGVCQVYSGRMDQYLYIDTLENAMLPSRDLLIDDHMNWIYQQDNAPCHKAKKVDAWFRENNISVLPWPARSPDLNPIEQIWSIIDKKLVGVRLSNLAELEKAVVKEWQELPPSICVNLVESMPKRLEMCIKAKGGHFKY